ncbi:GNAT family N-acetyltransferase [Polaribacter aestuariivivens]|uniref:GNAT family N-acetyltransferase n=1 Tax=Polaribacter aestuariivivens TaxID=2304626 RepID=A0A5S3N8P3_9FLAO|nr:GNAT family N-acetyltransferase [Polaribacter aestuariivivens]TMM31402.1 GNAT family N-acetyltransferase [Polaribacter aestuariivivens]
MIFETERLLIRKLHINDLKGFHSLESNPNVLKFATGNVKNFKENKNELKDLIRRYQLPYNNFWIYAVVLKENNNFIGTVALVKDGIDDEIGYRFIEAYWKNGFATELCNGLIAYCKQLGIPKLVGYVVDENIASAKILKRLNFKVVKHFISENMQMPETKYELFL